MHSASSFPLPRNHPSAMGTILGADLGSYRGAIMHYAVPNMQTTAWLASLLVSTGWWRGFGLMANTFAVESLIDELAQVASLDPLAFRLSHLNEIVRIPVIDYIAVLVLAGLFWLGLWLARLIRSRRSPDAEIARA